MEGLQLNIWSILIFIGAVQGFFLARAIWTHRELKANRYLGVFLFIISIHLVEYTIAISGLSIELPHTIASTYPLIFLLGPAFYLYTRMLIAPDSKLSLKDFLHLIPAILVLLAFLPFYLQSGEEKVSYLLEIASDEGLIEVPMEQLMFMFFHVIQMLLYVFFSFRNIQSYKQMLSNFDASTIHHKKYHWLKQVVLFYLAFLVIYFISLLLIAAFQKYAVEVDYVVVIILALLTYLIGYAILKNPVLLDKQMSYQLKEQAVTAMTDLKDRLLNYFKTEKPYLNEELKIDDVSRTLQVPSYQLSRLINESFGKNFFEFTNENRVEEAKRILEDPACKEMKIIAVAYDTGFGNKSTFNRVFKNITGFTPSAYREKFIS